MMNKIWKKVLCLVVVLVFVGNGVSIGSLQQKAPLEQEKTTSYPRVFEELNLSIQGTPLLDQPVELTCFVKTTPYMGMNTSIEIILPEGFEFVSGNLSWSGYIAKNDTAQVKATIKAVKTGNWIIGAWAGPSQHPSMIALIFMSPYQKIQQL